MSRLPANSCILPEVEVPDEACHRAEQIVGRKLTSRERATLIQLFELTVRHFDMRTCEPKLAQVRKWLNFLAKRGAWPAEIVTPLDHFHNRLRVIAERRPDASPEEVLAEVLSSPMAGEVELRAAVDYVEADLRADGIDPASAKPDQIIAAAQRSLSGLTRLIKQGRPPRDDFGLIWGWADLAEHLGMAPTASYKPGQQRHISPFLRWLEVMVDLMPARTRKAFKPNLGEHVEDALHIRRVHALDSGLFRRPADRQC
jgi:hypothetical protein